MDAKLQLNPIVLGDLKRAAQHVLDFFCQLGLVRLAMLFPLDAGACSANSPLLPAVAS